MNLYGYEFQRESDLMHYGVLGMKWGVRRYQPYSVRGRKSGEGGKEVGEAKSLSSAEIKRLNKKYDADHHNYTKKDIKSWSHDSEGRLTRESDYYKWADIKRIELQKANREKTSKERDSELKSAYDAWDKEDFDENGHDEKIMLNLQRKIYDYVYGEPGNVAVSQNAKKFEKKYDHWYNNTPLKKYSKEWFQERNKIRLEGCGVILNDLGYDDTEANRRRIYGLVYDTANLPIDDKR